MSQGHRTLRGMSSLAFVAEYKFSDLPASVKSQTHTAAENSTTNNRFVAGVGLVWSSYSRNHSRFSTQSTSCLPIR